MLDGSFSYPVMYIVSLRIAFVKKILIMFKE